MGYYATERLEYKHNYYPGQKLFWKGGNEIITVSDDYSELVKLGCSLEHYIITYSGRCLLIADLEIIKE